MMMTANELKDRIRVYVQNIVAIRMIFIAYRIVVVMFSMKPKQHITNDKVQMLTTTNNNLFVVTIDGYFQRVN
jgi:hypothetical protein